MLSLCWIVRSCVAYAHWVVEVRFLGGACSRSWHEAWALSRVVLLNLDVQHETIAVVNGYTDFELDGSAEDSREAYAKHSGLIPTKTERYVT